MNQKNRLLREAYELLARISTYDNIYMPAVALKARIAKNLNIIEVGRTLPPQQVF
jgi:hypothetical protein